MGLKRGGYLAPDNSRIICIYFIAPIFTALFSFKYSHAIKYWLPRSHANWLNFWVYTSTQGVSCNALVPCEKLVLLPPSTPARSIALLSTLTDIPVAADPSRDFELSAGQPMLGLPPRVIFLFPPRHGHPAPSKVEGSRWAARPNSVFTFNFPSALHFCYQTPRYLQPEYALHLIISSFQRHSHPKLLSGPILPPSSFFSQISVTYKFYSVFLSSLIVFCSHSLWDRYSCTV